MHHVCASDFALAPLDDSTKVRVLYHNGATVVTIVTTLAELTTFVPRDALRETDIVAVRWVFKRKSAPAPMTKNVDRADYVTEWRYYNEFDAAEERRRVCRRPVNDEEKRGRRARLRRECERLEERIGATYCLNEYGCHFSFVVYQALRRHEVALYDSREWLIALEEEARPLNPPLANLAASLACAHTA